MHVPDHVISNGTELLAGVSAAAVIASVVLETRGRTERVGTTLLRAPERIAPQAATAALVFALQMVNVPVLAGTSGHLLGGALATALVGSRRALLAVSSVVVAQALLFADGGVGALGVNLWLIAILPVAVATVARHLLGVRSTHGTRWWASIGLGAAAAPVVSATAFAALFALGAVESGAAPSSVASAMIRTHAAVAVAELAITLAVVGLIGWALARRSSNDTVPLWGMAAGAAVGLSLVASSAPDGLARVLGDLDLAVAGPGSILSGSPLAGYAVIGLDGAWSTSLAGVAGLAAAWAVCAALALMTRPPLRARPAAVAP